MTNKYCDRCDEQMPGNGSICFYNSDRRDGASPTEEYDVCDKCKNEIINYMEKRDE